MKPEFVHHEQTLLASPARKMSTSGKVPLIWTGQACAIFTLSVQFCTERHISTDWKMNPVAL